MARFGYLVLAVVLVLAQVDDSRSYALRKGDDVLSLGPTRQAARVRSEQGFATEVADLLSSPTAKKTEHHKKRKSNSSGKSKEGGFYKSYGSDAEGEKGYVKETFGKGEHGYKNYDTFHKKLGDKYGFEEHEAYGKQHQHQPQASETKQKKVAVDHEGAGTEDAETYAEGDGGEYYSEGGGDGENYSGGGDEGGSSYSGSGEAEGYYSSGEAADGSAESYSSDGSGEDY